MVLALVAVMAGVVLGLAAGVLYGRFAGWADPNWWLRNWSGVIWPAVISGALFGLLTAPCVALLLWRKNLLLALPILYLGTLFTVTWFVGASVVMIPVAFVTICGTSVLLKFVLWLFYAYSQNNAIALFALEPSSRRIVHHMYTFLVVGVAGAYILPLPIWALVSFRRKDWATIFGKAPKTKRSISMTTACPACGWTDPRRQPGAQHCPQCGAAFAVPRRRRRSAIPQR